VNADAELETLEPAGLVVAGKIRLVIVDAVLPGNFGIASLLATAAAEAAVVGRGSDPVFCRVSILQLPK